MARRAVGGGNQRKTKKAPEAIIDTGVLIKTMQKPANAIYVIAIFVF
jgi:hypothetical protein